jgi:hypothetical protein
VGRDIWMGLSMGWLTTKGQGLGPKAAPLRKYPDILKVHNFVFY